MAYRYAPAVTYAGEVDVYEWHCAEMSTLNDIEDWRISTGATFGQPIPASTRVQFGQRIVDRAAFSRIRTDRPTASYVNYGWEQGSEFVFVVLSVGPGTGSLAQDEFEQALASISP